MVVWNDLSNTQWLEYPSQSNILRRSYVNGFLDVSQNIVARKDIESYGDLNLNYVETIPPYDIWAEYGQLFTGTETDTTYANNLGKSVAMDAPGVTIVIGAMWEDNTNVNQGTVKVYSYNIDSQQWVQKGQTITGSGSGSSFASAVDINDAGNRILITEPDTDKVHIYDYNSDDDTWTVNASISLPHGYDGGRLSGNGNAFLITDADFGFTYNGVNYTNIGEIEVWRNTSGNTWTQFLHRGGNIINGYGFRGSSISYDGSLVATLQFNYTSENTTNTGLIRLHRWNGTNYDTAFDIYGNVNEKLGISSDFSKDGSVLAISSNTNTVKVYNIASSKTTTQKGSTLSFTNVCHGVRLSDDGNIMLITVKLADKNGLTDNGEAFVYEFLDDDWVLKANTIPGLYKNAKLGQDFGTGLAISGDGTKIILGGGQAEVTASAPQGYVQCYQFSIVGTTTYEVHPVGAIKTSASNGIQFQTINDGVPITNMSLTPSGEVILPNGQIVQVTLGQLTISEDGTTTNIVNPGDLNFGTQDQVHMTITSNGNVGIGTTTPTYKLQVNGNANLGGYVDVTGDVVCSGYGRFYGGGNGFNTTRSHGIWLGTYNTNQYCQMQCVSTTGDTWIDFVKTDGPGNADFHGRIRFEYGNNRIVAWPNLVNTSDDRVKHNEKIVTNAIATIDKLVAKRYFKTNELYDASHNFILDSSGNPIIETDASGNPTARCSEEIGFIAQDVEKIPELKFCVIDVADIVDSSGNILEKSAKALDYNNIFCLSIAALQELNKVVTSEKEKVAILETQQANIEARLSALQEVDSQLQEEKDKIATLEAQVENLLTRVSALESG